MTREKVKQLLELGRTLKEELVVVTKAQHRVFVDFSNEEYEDIHINDTNLHIWYIKFDSWKLVLLEDIEFIEFH